MAQLAREGRVLPEAAGGSPAGLHPDRSLGSLTSPSGVWAPNHLFSCPQTPPQSRCSGPRAGLSEAAAAWLFFSAYFASAPGGLAGVRAGWGVPRCRCPQKAVAVSPWKGG